MKVSIKPNNLTLVDKIAISLYLLYNSEDSKDRKFIGVYSNPYNIDVEKLSQEKEMEAFCDEIINDEPHSYGWRDWGKRAENLLEELKKQNLEIKDLKNE